VIITTTLLVFCSSITSLYLQFLTFHCQL